MYVKECAFYDPNGLIVPLLLLFCENTFAWLSHSHFQNTNPVKLHILDSYTQRWRMRRFAAFPILQFLVVCGKKILHCRTIELRIKLLRCHQLYTLKTIFLELLTMSICSLDFWKLIVAHSLSFLYHCLKLASINNKFISLTRWWS